MKKSVFTGVATALVTPFNQDLSINYRKFKELIEFQIKEGADALVVCGTTGESPTLNDDEKIKLFNIAVETANCRIPIIAGTGSNSTEHSIYLSQEAERCGADALLCVTPYYNKTSQTGLVKHYIEIADRVEIPIIVYNVPSRTGLNVKPETYEKLSKHKNICGIKEANGDISSVSETISLCNDTSLYSGNDDQIVPILSLGGKGVISVTSNILPGKIHSICYEFFRGNIEKSRQIQLELVKLNKLLFSDVNPIPIKAAMNILGLNVGKTRLPLTDISDENFKKLENLLN